MKTQRLLIASFLMTFAMQNGWPQKTVVWNQPATESGTVYFDGYFNPAVDVTRVELKRDGGLRNFKTTLRLSSHKNRTVIERRSSPCRR